MEGCEVRDLDVQTGLSPIKLCVRVAAKRWLAKSPHQRVKNFCVWSALATEIFKEEI